jgi:Flp pilus assembly protein TadD
MPCTRRRLAVACLVFLMVRGVAVWAQMGVGNIIGELRVRRGDFPGRVFVELQLRGATINSTYCDDEGKFGFYGLVSNPYRVVIRDERFEPVDQPAVLDTSISAMTIVQVTLSPREPVRKGSTPALASGRNPNLIEPADYRRHFPKNAIKEFDKGVAADKNRRLDEAIHHYERSIALAPDFYPAHNNLGSGYLSKADFADAEKQFREVLRLNQNDSQAYFNLANVFTLTRRFDDAEKVLQQGLQKQPDSAFGHFLQGSLYARQGRADAAEAALKRCLELDRLMSKAHLALVNLYLQEQRKGDAIEELRTFLKDSPGDPLAPKAREVLAKLGGGAGQ